MQHFVYEYELPNGQIYVGYTSNPRRRHTQHRCSVRSGKKWLFHATIRKLGCLDQLSMRVVFKTDDKEEALRHETCLIRSYQAAGCSLNEVEDGHGIQFMKREDYNE